MKTTTLQDFHAMELPDTTDFFSANRMLKPAEFRDRVQKTYGTPASRDVSLRQTVNEITLLYLDSPQSNKD